MEANRTMFFTTTRGYKKKEEKIMMIMNLDVNFGL